MAVAEREAEAMVVTEWEAVVRAVGAMVRVVRAVEAMVAGLMVGGVTVAMLAAKRVVTVRGHLRSVKAERAVMARGISGRVGRLAAERRDLARLVEAVTALAALEVVVREEEERVPEIMEEGGKVMVPKGSEAAGATPVAGARIEHVPSFEGALPPSPNQTWAVPYFGECRDRELRAR